MGSDNINESLESAQKLVYAGKFLDAINHYSAILAIHPDNADIWLRLGELQGEYCLFDDGIKCIERSISINPNKSHAWLSLALLQRAARRFKDAKRSGLRAVAIDYEMVEAWELLAAIAELLGEHEEVETCRMHLINLKQVKINA